MVLKYPPAENSEDKRKKKIRLKYGQTYCASAGRRSYLRNGYLMFTGLRYFQIIVSTSLSLSCFVGQHHSQLDAIMLQQVHTSLAFQIKVLETK